MDHFNHAAGANKRTYASKTYARGSGMRESASEMYSVWEGIVKSTAPSKVEVLADLPVVDGDGASTSAIAVKGKRVFKVRDANAGFGGKGASEVTVVKGKTQGKLTREMSSASTCSSESSSSLQQRPFIIACTRLRKKDAKRLEQAAVVLGDGVWRSKENEENGASAMLVSDSFSMAVTHVVVSEEPSRTAKVLNGILRGAWVVRVSWVKRSLEQGRWLPEVDFEARDVFPIAKAARVWRESGELASKFLAGMRVCLRDETDPPPDKLALLVLAANGRVVQTSKEADVVLSATGTREEGDSTRVLCARPSWLFDGIEAGVFRRTGPRQPKKLVVTKQAKSIEEISKDLETLTLADSGKTTTVEDVVSELEALTLDKEPGPINTTEVSWKVMSGDLFVVSHVLEFLGSEHTKAQALGCVNRIWQTSARLAANREAVICVAHACAASGASLEKGESIPLTALQASGDVWRWKPEALRRNFPTGRFLAEGGCKKVFKVWCDSEQRNEAVSVMDYASVFARSDLAMISQDVNVSLQVSELVARGVCNYFINSYQVFQLGFPPPNDLWGRAYEEKDSDDRCNNGNSASPSSSQSNIYQYIRMELCELGDMEEYIKTLEGQMLSVDLTRQALLQMTAALHLGRKHINLRHFDVKLLNFFLAAGGSSESDIVDTGAECGRFCTKQASREFVVKLADFGTADTRKESLGCNAMVRHFTTLENAPPEFYFCGDSAPADSADSFALGLCMLHLYTGSRPYEEIMQTCCCPALLSTALKCVWRQGINGNFGTLKQVLDDDADDVCCHTIYRFVVLLGVDHLRRVFPCSPVTHAIETILGSEAKASRAIAKAQAQFEEDRAAFSLLHGANERFSIAWARLGDEGSEVLQGLLHADLHQRLSFQQVLQSNLFKDLRIK